DDFFWLGDSIICTNNDLFHKVIGLSNEGNNPMNIKNVHKIVEGNLNKYFDGGNIKVNTIKDDGVRHILGYKYNHGSILDEFLGCSHFLSFGIRAHFCELQVVCMGGFTEFLVLGISSIKIS
ncbi:hypothetical protein, partial [Enterobacter hormaechei]|uniref:hypothetical protein n=1 Tax=Enterobacter hormaechei TaxID=158836 RepID=UPI0023E38CE6